MKFAADSARKNAGFPRSKRLSNVDVVHLFRRGRRAQCRSFDVQYQVRKFLAPGVGGRIAIAAPKKQLSTAVARNRIKRLVREVFRHSNASRLELDMLFKYRLKSDGRSRADRRQIRVEVIGLLNTISVQSGTT